MRFPNTFVSVQLDAYENLETPKHWDMGCICDPLAVLKDDSKAAQPLHCLFPPIPPSCLAKSQHNLARKVQDPLVEKGTIHICRAVRPNQCALAETEKTWIWRVLNREK